MTPKSQTMTPKRQTMTSKWDFNGRSVDLTEKSKLVIIDFDNTRTSL